MDKINQQHLRAARHFLNPSKNTLTNAHVYSTLIKARDEGKYVLILHRGSDGCLRSSAGKISEVKRDSTHVNVNLEEIGIRPFAVVSFIDKNLVTSGRITQEEFNDLFDPVLTTSIDDREDRKGCKMLSLGYSERAVVIIPFEAKNDGLPTSEDLIPNPIIAY